MKSIVSSFLLLISIDLSAQVIPECKFQEAQFSGRISRVEVGRRAENKNCKIYLTADLSRGDIFNPSQICPLDIDLLQTSYLYDSTCNLDDYEIGKTLSGVLVKPIDSDVMVID